MTGRLAFKVVSLMLWVSAASPLQAAADASAVLRRFVDEVRSAELTFRQEDASAKGGKRRDSSGTLEFERPNNFRFVYEKPYEQLIVSDGKTLWQYDPDLQQVMIKPFSQALGSTPAALLAGGRRQLDKDFTLNNLAERDGLAWVEALPKDKETPFQSVELGFKDHDLAAAVIVDAFGQQTRLQFSHIKVNVRWPKGHFTFSPPPGVDIVKP